MAIQTINIGNQANDGTGDDLREAFVKVNANFEDLYSRVPESTTAANLLEDTDGIKGIFTEKVDYELKFKNLVAGTDISLTDTANSIVINSTVASPIFISDDGSVDIGNYGHVLRLFGSGTLPTTSASNNTITINTHVANDSNPTFTANVNMGGFNILNAGTVNAVTVNATGFIGDISGNLTGNVYGQDSTLLIDSGSKTIYGTVAGEITGNIIIEDFDYGSIGPAFISTVRDFIFANTNTDFGSITTDRIAHNFGSI